MNRWFKAHIFQFGLVSIALGSPDRSVSAGIFAAGVCFSGPAGAEWNPVQ